MTTIDQDSHAAFVQSMVADVHAKLARWFRSENADLTADEVQSATDYMLLHHLLVFAVNRDRSGAEAVTAMMERFAEAMASVGEMVREAENGETAR